MTGPRSEGPVTATQPNARTQPPRILEEVTSAARQRHPIGRSHSLLVRMLNPGRELRTAEWSGAWGWRDCPAVPTAAGVEFCSPKRSGPVGHSGPSTRTRRESESSADLVLLGHAAASVLTPARAHQNPALADCWRRGWARDVSGRWQSWPCPAGGTRAVRGPLGDGPRTGIGHLLLEPDTAGIRGGRAARPGPVTCRGQAVIVWKKRTAAARMPLATVPPASTVSTPALRAVRTPAEG